MHFGENELFPSLIGLSPLPTVHPKTFQRLRVRSSTSYYRGFNLTMGRSPRFASASTDFRPIQTCFRYGFVPEVLNLAREEQLVGSLCKRHAVARRLRPLVSARFQDLFHSLIQGSFNLSLTVLVHYRSLRSI